MEIKRWPLPKKINIGKEKKVQCLECISEEHVPTLSSASGRNRIGRSAAPVQYSNTANSHSRIKAELSHLDDSPIIIAPTQQQILRRGTEELRVRVEIVVIRILRYRCLREDALRRAVRAAGHTGGGILDVDIVDGVSTAHGDDEPGGIVFRVENFATA